MIMPKSDRGEPPLGDEPHFLLGQLVLHLKYGYRGVVAEYNMTCEASEAWYRSNQSQPSREQPWYHVLVDGAAHTTYVAQENLEVDTSGAPVIHPLLQYYFEDFKNGRYVRNDTSWHMGKQ